MNNIIDIAFEGIRQALKRDLRKYNVYIDKQRINGAKGGRPKKKKETQKTGSIIWLGAQVHGAVRNWQR